MGNLHGKIAATTGASKRIGAGIAKALAAEGANEGMDTPANRIADPGADYSKWVHPCQVAKLLVHLVSDDASQISGAVIPIYGGEA